MTRRIPASARLAFLLGLLLLVVTAWIYDYHYARPGVEAAEMKVRDFVAARVHLGLKEDAPITPAAVHQLLGMRPTWVDKRASDQYEVEYYCWWGPAPLLNMRRQFLAIVYVGDESHWHFASYHKNERPPRAALPMPFLEKQSPAAAAAADVTNLPLKDRPHLRHPVSAAWIKPHQRLAVANQQSGSISIVDFPQRMVVAEVAVGAHLADIAAHPQGRWLITIDEEKHELIILQPAGDSLTVTSRLPVSPYPASIAVSQTGEQISVASLWSRKLTLFQSSGADNTDAPFSQVAVIPLPFNAREHRFASDETLLVKDAFTNRSYEVNIRDQTSTPCDKCAFVSPDPSLRLIKGTDLRARSRSGQEELFDPNLVILLGPAPPPTPEERGEELFYSRQLSSGKNCHDCHAHGHTNYQLADTLGDDTTGTPKRIPTLFGTSVTYPWAWNGTISELDDQVRKSLENTMHLRHVTPQQVIDITAFLHTLPPPPPLRPATDDPEDQTQLSRGQLLFTDLGCVKCHVPQLAYTSPDTYDVGFSDEQGLRKFNPPSLLGVGQGYSFFHDGRAPTLEEVLTVHGHQLSRELSTHELADLLRFLRSL